MVPPLPKNPSLHHTEIFLTRDIPCILHTWTPPSPPRSTIVLFHGYGGHSLFPTTRHLAEYLSGLGSLVLSLDFPGHGLSPGIRGLVPHHLDLVTDARDVVRFALDGNAADVPLFLAGASMGAAIALKVSIDFPDDRVDGLILLAPMIGMRLPRWQKWLLRGLNRAVPGRKMIPARSVSVGDAEFEVQFRDPVRREEIALDALQYRKRMRPASAVSCWKLAESVTRDLERVRVPFFCGVALQDSVVDNSGAGDLLRKSSSNEKVLREYDASHGMMCDAVEVREEIERDISDWLEERILISEISYDGLEELEDALFNCDGPEELEDALSL